MIPRAAAPFFLLLVATAALRAAPTLAPIFTDHMILQQGRPLPVWGRAFTGEIITVTFGPHTATARTDDAGRWRLDLPPLAPSAKPASLVITSSAEPGAPITLRDVLVGEVWFCAGQSNMEFTLRKSARGPADADAAGGLPIREFRVATPFADPAAPAPAKWVVGTPQTVRDFTAVGFYFAREIFEKTRHPVGLITTAWGGTPIEHFLDLDALAPALRATPPFSQVIARRDRDIAAFPADREAWEKKLAQWTADRAAAKAAGQPFAARRPSPPYTPNQHRRWNGLILPLAPAAIRGVLWYQAEHNWNRPDEYAALFQALIAQWRHAWAQGDDLPFYFVQLPNFGGSGRLWPWLREAQQKALALPATGIAVTIDIGEARDQHPRNKHDVGRRLALLALADVYGSPVPDRGRSPAMTSVTPAADVPETHALRVRFGHATGLATDDAAPPDGFEIAGPDRRFVRAEARVESSAAPPAVIVYAPAVTDPVALRYAWSDSPRVNLRNAAGLPAAPFRTDDWPRVPGDLSALPASTQ